MDTHFNPDEKLYRAVYPDAMFWKENGKVSSADFFEQTRALLADVNDEHRLELEKMLAKIETTHAIGNKKECGNWFGQFFSLASIADCITVAQPLLPLISWICKN